MDTWCCRVASLDIRPAHGLVLHSLFALWPRGISFGPGGRWALELRSRALWYLPPEWLGSWWHEKRQIGASPARVTLIRERAAQSADHLAEKRQKWAVVGEVVCDLGKSRNTANTTTYNSDFPAPHSRQVTTPATRCVQPSGYMTCRVAGFVPCVPWYALLVRTWAYYSESGLSHPHVDPLFRVWATPPTYGTAG